MLEDKVRIKIEVEDLTEGFSTKLEKVTKLYPGLGYEGEFPYEFGVMVSQMMDALSYPGYKKETIFLESVTLEEYDELLCYLQELRDKEKNKDEDE